MPQIPKFGLTAKGTTDALPSKHPILAESDEELMEDSQLQQRLARAAGDPVVQTPSVFDNLKTFQAEVGLSAQALLAAFSAAPAVSQEDKGPQRPSSRKMGEEVRVFPSAKCARTTVSTSPAAARTEQPAAGDQAMEEDRRDGQDFGGQVVPDLD